MISSASRSSIYPNFGKFLFPKYALFLYVGNGVLLNSRNERYDKTNSQPAVVASSIMLESVKKLIILNLILGRPQHLPPYRAPPIQRLAQMKCQKYHVSVYLTCNQFYDD